MTDLLDEILANYNPERLDPETSELLESFLAKAVLKHVFLQEKMDDETQAALELVKRVMK
ncbi:hypothetical protein [Archaeoglobus neptunius]|uniref:hypothetical protein n=1 Tax=Archaeoglobus neptunius TaxID=2798580 RepID=UPI001928EC3C|nr:hypothetical protein [Archaeoglobus neptunius]